MSLTVLPKRKNESVFEAAERQTEMLAETVAISQRQGRALRIALDALADIAHFDGSERAMDGLRAMREILTDGPTDPEHLRLMNEALR